ncbi:MAG: LCP family protein [Acidimicrobiales bacterium]
MSRRSERMADQRELAAPGAPLSRSKRQRHASKARRRVKRTLVTLSIVVLVLIVAAVGYGFYLNHGITRVAVHNLVPGATTGADAGSENILMVGSTSRCALTVQNPAYGICSQGVNGVNSDVIMILHVNSASRTLSLLSIPRDLFLPNARSGPYGGYKIDAALYQGQSQLVKVIEQDFGIPIQHSVELNFDTFANVVNALGGLNMYFPMPVFDAYSGLNIPTAGCVHLDGYRALQVVRARHLQYKGPGVTTNNHNYWPYEHQSDLGRIIRDHEFLRVLASTVAHKGLGNPVTDLNLVQSIVGQLKFDNGFSTSNMVNLLLTYHAVNINSVPQLTLPVSVGPNTSYYYQGAPKGSIEFPANTPDLNAIDSFLRIGPNIDTMTGAPLPSPGSVTVSVLNGTGVYNQAATTETALGALGFRGVGVGNSQPVATQSETFVRYANPSDIGAAEAVMHSLSGAVVMLKAPTTDGAQVTVVTGSQFSVNAPAPSTTGGTSTSTTGGTSTSTTSTLSGGFQPPSSPKSSLRPWDPRACPASSGSGK